ncbi:UNVERIFIED_CONTAM: hypothetical protein Cloal_1008 [Acetivibrio alkalicellulosi]
MNKVKKMLVAIIIASLLLGNVFFYQRQVQAQAFPINVYVNSYVSGVLTINWDKPLAASSFSISYHTPQGIRQEINSNDDVNTYAISGLQNDFIYDIRVEVFNNLGNKIGEGLLYFLPRITFYASSINQERQALPGGGYEIGHNPRLKLRWVMPKVWHNGQLLEANDPLAIESIRNNLNSIYHNNLDITNLNFRINVSTNMSNLNSGSSQAAINIDYDDSNYRAHVSGRPNVRSNIVYPDQNGFMSFDIMGRKDLVTSLPPLEEFALPHPDILPGTVYYMNIKLAFNNDAGNTRYAVTVGRPSDLNGSLLMGAFPYTYTPIRFELSKDAADNVYVKVYRVNQGSLDLPRLFYEIQTSDDPSIPGDWAIKKTIDDTFFAPGSQSAITVIPDIGPNNRIYYKIVVKTDTTTDRIESPPMHYILADDTSKSPVPRDIIVIDRQPVSRTITVDGESVLQSSTDVTISWAKPSNWDEIRENTESDNDVIYHIMLNTHQLELEMENYPELKADGKTYGYFPLRYRRVLYVSSKSLREVGNRLEYTIRGFDLFKGEYFEGLDQDGKPIIIEEPILNSEGYPEFLLPNTVYYLQMYTTSAVYRNTTELENMSDKSVIVSFTTRSAGEIDVPLPINLRLIRNEADVFIGETTEISNYIELQFDKVNINWRNYISDLSIDKKVYYDIYMSTRPDINSFKPIGTTENLNGDLAFVGADDIQSTSIRFIVRNFSSGTEAYAAFGDKLRPNTTYYFIAKTRLYIEDQEPDKESRHTALLPVTTVRGQIGDPDESSKRPLTPIDFNIAKDESGNLKVTGGSVVFTWSRAETDVIYNIICTSRRVKTDEGPYEGGQDALYQSFTEKFGNILLDPSAETLEKNFTYNPITREMSFTIDEWLFPNRLYYFSIRALNKDDHSIYSSWVCIPVTTSLIEQPEFLEVVSDIQLGVFFNDADINTRSEDYSIYIKADNDLRFNLLTRDKYTLAKLGTVSYVRLLNLKPNTSYDIRVYKNNGATLVYTNEGLWTRNIYNNVEVKWRGISGYKYELAIRTALDDEYTLLLDENLKSYINVNGNILPYYGEKNFRTSGTNFEDFYARIETIPVKNQQGELEHVPLKSNTKYYIRVRAVKIDDVDPSLIAYSKYLGPVEVRTDFNQEDYDEEDTRRRKEAAFLDKIRQLEENLYWRIDIGNGATNKILLKRERMIDAIKNSLNNVFTLDISKHAIGHSMDSIYIPEDVIEALNTYNRSLTIKTWGAEYTIRPSTINTDNRQASELMDQSNINDIYYRFDIERKDKPLNNLPKGTEAISKINSLKVNVEGTTITSNQLEEQIKNRIYDENSGIVGQKLNNFLNTTTKSTVTSRQLEEAINELIKEIEFELSIFLRNRIEGGTGLTPVIAGSKEISDFIKPMMISLSYNNQRGLKIPHISYKGMNEWHKVSNMVYFDSSVVFNIGRTGEYAVLVLNIPIDDIYDGHPLGDDIRRLLSKYDLRKVFGSLESFYPEENVRVNELILLYEVVIEKDTLHAGLSIGQKAQRNGLESLLNRGGVARDVNRQETARVIMMVYSNKTGANINNLLANRYIYISDENKIDPNNYRNVLMTIDMNIFGLNERSGFEPNSPVTRGDMVSAFVRVLNLTGDL